MLVNLSVSLSCGFFVFLVFSLSLLFCAAWSPFFLVLSVFVGSVLVCFVFVSGSAFLA